MSNISGKSGANAGSGQIPLTHEAALGWRVPPVPYRFDDRGCNPASIKVAEKVGMKRRSQDERRAVYVLSRAADADR